MISKYYKMSTCITNTNTVIGFTPSLRMKESLIMSEIIKATWSRDSAQPIRMQVSFDFRTFLSSLTFLNLESIRLILFKLVFTILMSERIIPFYDG